MCSQIAEARPGPPRSTMPKGPMFGRPSPFPEGLCRHDLATWGSDLDKHLFLRLEVEGDGTRTPALTPVTHRGAQTQDVLEVQGGWVGGSVRRLVGGLVRSTDALAVVSVKCGAGWTGSAKSRGRCDQVRGRPGGLSCAARAPNVARALLRRHSGAARGPLGRRSGAARAPERHHARAGH